MDTKAKPIIPLALIFFLTGILPLQFSATHANEFVVPSNSYSEPSGSLSSSFVLGEIRPNAAIAIGQTIQGALGDGKDDGTFSTGDGQYNNRLTDFHFFDTQVGQSYVITVNSAAFPAASRISKVTQSNDSGHTSTPLQHAEVFNPGFQVQYSGILKEGGQHVIYVFSRDPNTTAGQYTLSLSSGSAACRGGTLENPIKITLNQPLNCALESTDHKFTNGKHYKAFHLNAPGGTLIIKVTSNAFTPRVSIRDPDNSQTFNSYDVPATVDGPAGAFIFLINSNESERTGPFTVVVEKVENSQAAAWFDNLSQPDDALYISVY